MKFKQKWIYFSSNNKSTLKTHTTTWTNNTSSHNTLTPNINISHEKYTIGKRSNHSPYQMHRQIRAHTPNKFTVVLKINNISNNNNTNNSIILSSSKRTLKSTTRKIYMKNFRIRTMIGNKFKISSWEGNKLINYLLVKLIHPSQLLVSTLWKLIRIMPRIPTMSSSNSSTRITWTWWLTSHRPRGAGVLG